MIITRENIVLRALEISDLELLYKLENDIENWYLSSVNSPFSKTVLEKYIHSSDLDIYSTKQIRFVISDSKFKLPLGFLDLYDFDPQNKRAGVGIIISSEFQQKGIAKIAILNLFEYVKKVLDLHQIYASVTENNKPSLTLFTSLGFVQTGIKKDWIFREGSWLNQIEFQFLLE